MRKLLFILAALISVSQAQTIQYIGAPTTTVISKGNFRSDSLFYLPKRSKLPTDSGAVRYQISDSSVYYWTGWNWRRLGVHIDTASMLNPYLRGSGTANYFPKFDASRSVINSKLYESGTNLLFNTTNPSFTSAGITTIENNATSSAVYTYKIADTIRAYMGYGGSSTFDINNLRAGDIRFYTNATLRGRFQTDGTFRLNSLTGTGSRIVTADADGVLSATSSATGLVDTLVLSTRYWRQKGDDSLAAIIATKGSGTVTSVATGYGLSGGTITTTGTIIVDSAIVASRLRVGKVVDSLSLVKQDLLTNPVTGTGTTNYVPKFMGTSTIGNSTIFDDGEVKINTSSDLGDYKLQVNGSLITSTGAIFAGTSGSVGIGTTIPSYKLDVVGDIRSTTRLITTGNLTPSSWITNATTVGYSSSGGYGWIAAGGSSGYVPLSLYGEVLVNTTTDAGDYKLQVSGNAYVTGTTVLAATSGNVGVGISSGFSGKVHVSAQTSDLLYLENPITSGSASYAGIRLAAYDGSSSSSGLVLAQLSNSWALNSAGGIYPNSSAIVAQKSNGLSIVTSNGSGDIRFNAGDERAVGEHMRLTPAAELFVGHSGTPTDAGDYKLQVSGNAYVTGTTVLAATSGRVGIATTTPGANSVLDVNGNLFIRDTARINFRNSQTNLGSYTIGYSSTSPRFPIRLVLSEDPTNQRYFEVGHYTGDNIANTWNPQILMNAYNGSMSLGSTTAPVASAQLEVTSTTKGFLPPRMTTTQRDAISSPAAGLVIYNTTISKLQVYTTSWTDLH
jgi:hypothetical protein